MSKKKFTTGLESLFGNPSEEAFQEDSPLIDIEESPKRRERKERTKSSASGGNSAVAAKRSNKNFTSDLETLFEEAFNETVDEKREKANKIKEVKKVAKVRRKPLSGLDALIRRTGGMEYVEVNVPNKKRVSFVFEKDKVEQLKKIAKKRKLYLKDIIGEVMSSFIDKFEAEQGGEIAQ